MDELNKLEEYLKAKGIEYERIDETDGFMNHHQIIVYEDGRLAWDAVWNIGSYGREKGLLESMGDIVETGDTVEGWLTAQEIIERIERRTK